MVKETKRQICQVFSRVTGWIVPRTAANPGKQAEWMDRKQYINISKGNSDKL